MSKTLKTIALLASLLILLLFVLFAVSQTAQVVQLAEKVSPTLGTVVLWTLLVAFSILVVTPLVLFLRLPAPLSPPSSEDSPGFEAHLAARLAVWPVSPSAGVSTGPSTSPETRACRRRTLPLPTCTRHQT